MITIIDGNIGSGKSTLLNRLSKTHKVVKERIDEWPLEEFYSDVSKWALPLQIKILQTMTKPSNCLHERCLQSSNFVFWKYLLNTNQVTHIEDDIYQELFKLYEWKFDRYVYLRCSPEKCFENIKKRTQTGDSSVTLEYLKSIHDMYEDFIKTVPGVVIIDAEEDEDTVYKNVCKLVE